MFRSVRVTKWNVRLVAACVVALTSIAARAGMAFTYQGRLTESGLGVTGDYDMVFRLYDAASGGTQIGPTLTFDGVGGNPDPVSVIDGLVNAELDFGNVFDGASLWLDIEVRSSGGGAYTLLTPRQPLNATPYALYALSGPGGGLWTEDGDDIHNSNNGHVGVGTSTPAYQLDVSGEFRSNGRVAIGNDASFGLGSGPYPDFDRVFNFSHRIADFTGSTAWAPFLSTITLDPTQNVDSAQIAGNMLEAHTPDTCSRDLVFVTGLWGGALHNGTGNVASQLGSFLVSESPGAGTVTRNYGTLVSAGCGWNSDSSITDNYGVSILTGHWGDSGSIQTNRVLNVQSPLNTQPIDTNYGIYIEDQNVAQTTNYAIYSAGGDVHFNGNLDVTGTISKGGGSFKIDHPLHPENKYLYHSFVESPDMMNIYNGNVTTDDRGYAVVEMPDWFEALNRDFRYQLTVIDESDSDAFVQAKVVTTIAGNRFTIRSSAPNVRVSWQVTGVRHDAFANANRIPVEQDKPASLRGHYLHPAAFGKPAGPSPRPAAATCAWLRPAKGTAK